MVKEVAHKVDVTEATMQKYEAGQIKRVDIEMIEKIADAIGTTAAKLTGWLDKDAKREARERHLPKIKAQAIDIVLSQDEMEWLIEYRKANSGYDDEQIKRALAFYEAFNNATPQIRAAVETLLKSEPQEP